MTKREFYFDEEHPQAFVCSIKCAEEFDCEDRLNYFDLFYFLDRNLDHHNVRNTDGSWTTYLVLPDENEAYELEELIFQQYGRVNGIMYFSGCRLFNGADRHNSGWNDDPADFLEANGFDPAMADHSSFQLLDHVSDCYL